MLLSVHRPSERSGEDVDIILTRLREVKAFHRFPPPLLLQICACAFYECLEKGITCRYRNIRAGDLCAIDYSASAAPRQPSASYLKHTFLSVWCVKNQPMMMLLLSLWTVFRQGDIGTSWYAVLSGSLDVKVSETANHQVKSSSKFWLSQLNHVHMKWSAISFPTQMTLAPFSLNLPVKPAR